MSAPQSSEIYQRCLALTTAIGADTGYDQLREAFEVCTRCEQMVKDVASDRMVYENTLSRLALVKRYIEGTDCRECQRQNDDILQAGMKSGGKVDPVWSKKASLICMNCAARRKELREIKQRIVNGGVELTQEERAFLSQIENDQALSIAERLMVERKKFLTELKTGSLCYACSKVKESALKIADDLQLKYDYRVVSTPAKFIEKVQLTLHCLDRLRADCTVDLEFSLGRQDYLESLPTIKERLDWFYDRVSLSISMTEKELADIPAIIQRFKQDIAKF